jgi:hypothetical protein
MSTRELVEELVKRELLILNHYQLVVKDIKCPFQWWDKYEAMFPIISFHVPKIKALLDHVLK